MTPEERALRRALYHGLHGVVPSLSREDVIERTLDTLLHEGYHVVSTPTIQAHDDPQAGRVIEVGLSIDGRPLSVSWTPDPEVTDGENEERRRESSRELGRNILIELGLWNTEADLPVAWTVPDGDEYVAAMQSTGEARPGAKDGE